MILSLIEFFQFADSKIEREENNGDLNEIAIERNDAHTLSNGKVS